MQSRCKSILVPTLVVTLYWVLHQATCSVVLAGIGADSDSKLNPAP